MIRYILSLTRFHWGGIITAVLCAFLITAPLIAFPEYAGDAYRGININHFGTDEDFYLARANDVAEGHTLGQPFLSRGKEYTDPTFYKIEQVVMFPYVVFGLNAHSTIVDWYNTLNTIGVFLLALILYAFAFLLSKNRLLAVAIASFVIGGHSIIFYKTLFYDNFNIYGRSIFPYAASIPFFAFILLLYRATVEKRGWLTALGAGIFLGFLFYDYFYAWTFALALLGSLFLISLIMKSWASLKTTISIGIIGIILASPMLISFVHFFASGEGAQISYFLVAVHTHAFVMSVAGLATLALFFLHLWRTPQDKNNTFLFACILAGWVALEQQILSGRAIEYGHYYWYFIVPLSIIVGAYFVAAFIPRKIIPWFASLLIFLALVNTIGGQYQSFFTTIPEKMHDQQYVEPLKKLNSLPYGVVLAGNGNESFPLLITVYTNNDLFFSPSALVYHTSLEQMRETLVAYLALNKEAHKDPIDYVERSLTATTSSTYRNLYQDIEGYASGFDYVLYTKKLEEKDPEILRERKDLLSILRKEYREKVSSPDLLRAFLLKKGVRYILWDKDFYPEWDISSLAPLETIAKSGSVTLYALQP